MRAVSLRWRDMPKLVTGRVISFPKWAGPRGGRPDARIEEERDGDGRVNDAPEDFAVAAAQHRLGHVAWDASGAPFRV